MSGELPSSWVPAQEYLLACFVHSSSVTWACSRLMDLHLEDTPGLQQILFRMAKAARGCSPLSRKQR